MPRPRPFAPLAATSLAAALLLAGLTGCGSSPEEPAPASYEGEPIEVKGLEVPARATPRSVDLATGDGFEPRFWPGVNLGSTVPGHQPGELAPRAEDYRRWFDEMAELGVRVVRVYTLLDPSFYDELAAHNLANPEEPLYVVHGIWIPEERFLETGDLWHGEVLSEQRRITREVVSAVHGDLDVDERLGEADGAWRTDISRWVVGWSFGVELDPVALEQSERTNPPHGHDGRFFRSRGDSTSSEAWVARQLDLLAELDADHGWSRATTFTNWLTLDPLDHPHEPLEREDSISLDANHIEATKRWPGGYFASYHAYSYYPDFMRFTPRYANAPDPYAAYLEELREHHSELAVMITEFGVPSSLGAAHRGPLDRDQGDHDEAEALAIDGEMMEIIRDGGYAGGFIFQWVDEWFKFTWNTIDYEQPGDRRQLWRSPLTNEQHFGLVAAEAGLESELRIDGDPAEWEDAVASQVLWESPEGVLQLRAAHDEAYLYLLLTIEDEALLEQGINIGLDVRPGDGGGLPEVEGAPMEGADTALRIDSDGMTVRRAAWTDELAWQYGIARDYLDDVRPADMREGSGAWREPTMILNRPQVIPATGEEMPVELMSIAEHPLHSEDDDSRTLAAASAEAIEVRLPWALLGFSDPSSRRVTVGRADGVIETERLDDERRTEIEVYADSGELLAAAEPGYGFEAWQSVDYSERRKRGWDELAEVFARVAEPVGRRADRTGANRDQLRSRPARGRQAPR